MKKAIRRRFIVRSTPTEDSPLCGVPCDLRDPVEHPCGEGPQVQGTPGGAGKKLGRPPKEIDAITKEMERPRIMEQGERINEYLKNVSVEG